MRPRLYRVRFGANERLDGRFGQTYEVLVSAHTFADAEVEAKATLSANVLDPDWFTLVLIEVLDES